jgi:hypothetical protein
MLHKACGGRLKQQYVCSKEGGIVEKDDIAKGYEFAKGQYVTFTPEEIKALDEKATNSIACWARRSRPPVAPPWDSTQPGVSSTWFWCAPWMACS